MNSAPCILLVNQSLTFLTLTRQYLKRTNARVVDADNCASALEACHRHHPKLIYVATTLADPGGIECCRRIKADPEFSEVPIILMARDKDGDRATLSRRSNCDAIIGLPPVPQNLLAIGRSFLPEFREQRFACPLPARLILRDRQDTCESVDVSSNGVFLAHSTPPSLGQAVGVELQLQETGEMGPRITCQGQVVWVNSDAAPIKPNHPPGFGIRFTDLDARDAAVLNGFLRTLESTGEPLTALDRPTPTLS